VNEFVYLVQTSRAYRRAIACVLNPKLDKYQGSVDWLANLIDAVYFIEAGEYRGGTIVPLQE
jgi:hypothetical protein